MGHKLTEKDVAALTATCSKCGPSTAIAKNGRGWVCREGRREAVRRWRQAHPERARASTKRPVSKHRLEKRDGSPDTCALCGPVTPVVMGRGWGCPKRAEELGWKVFEEQPQPPCLKCKGFLDRFGSCPKCDADMGMDDKWIPEESRRHWSRSRGEWDTADGFSIRDYEAFLPDEPESVVPGWKTLGSLEPWTGVKPEYARLYGAGRK